METFVKSLKFFPILLLSVGCATIPGGFKESDLVWEERKFEATQQEVHAAMDKGFKTCISSNKFDVSKDSGRALPGMAEDEGLYIVRLKRLLTADPVFGFIRIKSIAENETAVRVGINKLHENPSLPENGDTIRKRWLNWASGDVDCS